MSKEQRELYLYCEMYNCARCPLRIGSMCFFKERNEEWFKKFRGW